MDALKINPSKPEGLVPPPKDVQYETPRQLHQPLITDNEHEEDDFRQKFTHQTAPFSANYAQWSHDDLPENQKTFHRYGLVRAPYDRQYDVAAQPKHPINEYNMNPEDDFRNVYNPNKGPNKWPNSHEDMRAGNYYHPYDLTVSRAQVQSQWSHDDLPENQKTFHRYGLVRAPYDRQYDVAAQPKHPIN